MMILRSGPTSPFGRKVKIAIKQRGLTDQVSIEATDTTNPSDTIHKQNPLGKIPALILEDGSVVHDSRVIVEYLDSLGSAPKLIPSAPKRWPVLTEAALADGIMEAALLLVYERRLRPEPTWSKTWVDSQQSKIDRGITYLEQHVRPLDGPPDVGQIGVACALGYLDLRHEGRWRKSSPKLVAWLDAFATAVPAFEETKVKA